MCGYAAEVADGVRIYSIHRSHWSSAGCTHDAVVAMIAVMAPATARQVRPTITQPGAARLRCLSWPPDRLAVTFASCPGWPTGTVRTKCEFCL